MKFLEDVIWRESWAREKRESGMKGHTEGRKMRPSLEGLVHTVVIRDKSVSYTTEEMP